MPPDGAAPWGSTLVLLVAMSDTNGGMFKEDAGTHLSQSVETGPFLSMLILIGACLANILWLTLVSVIAPIFAGAVLGNLDEDLRDCFGSHEPCQWHSPSRQQCRRRLPWQTRPMR